MEAPQGPENKIPRKTVPSGTSKNTAILLLCMGVASFLWLIIKLSDTYTWRVPVTLVYSNLPADRVPVKDLPKKSFVLVNATGIKLILAKFRIIDITLPIPYRSNMTQPFLLGRNLANELAGDMPPGYELLTFSPDTIYLQFDKKLTKKVPIRLAGEVTYAKQYEGRSIPTLMPDSVEVSGPESMIDTMRFWYTEPIEHLDLKESITSIVQLQRPAFSSITLDAPAVEYTLDVESYTEVTREIEIELLNVPANKKITPYPKKVTVTVYVGLSNLDAAKSANITATANFSNINLKKDRYVEVHLSGYPDYMRINGYEPRNIEFIVYN